MRFEIAWRESNIMTFSIYVSIQLNTRAIPVQSFKIASEIALLSLHLKHFVLSIAHLFSFQKSTSISLMSYVAEEVVNKFISGTVLYLIKTHGHLLNWSQTLIIG